MSKDDFERSIDEYIASVVPDNVPDNMDAATNRERQIQNPWLIDEIEDLLAEAIEDAFDVDSGSREFAAAAINALSKERLLSLLPIINGIAIGAPSEDEVRKIANEAIDAHRPITLRTDNIEIMLRSVAIMAVEKAFASLKKDRPEPKEWR